VLFRGYGCRMTPALLVEQQVAARPAAIWPLWTTAPGLARWWWPHLLDTTYDVEERPGGRYRIESSAAGIGVEGEFVSLDEPHELVLTWQWLHGGAAGPVDRVRIAFDERGADTLVRVTHEMAGDQEHDGYLQGWTDVLDRLAGLFTSAEKGTQG